MLKLIVWQFRYTWKAWTGALTVFTAAGLVVGFMVIGAASTIRLHLNHGTFNPITFFATPAIFGLMTLMLVISGVTRALIDKFKADYQLWAVLGANPTQLAGLIGGQMSLAGMIGGFLGYFLAFPVVDNYYAWVITIHGMREFPPIEMKLQLSSLSLTVLFLGLLIGVMGAINGKRVFTSAPQRRILTKNRQFGLSILGWIWWLIACGGLVYVYGLFYQKPVQLLKLFGSNSLEKTYLQALLALIFVMIIAVNASEKLI